MVSRRGSATLKNWKKLKREEEENEEEKLETLLKRSSRDANNEAVSVVKNGLAEISIFIV